MSSEHVEVLRVLRDRWARPDEKVALDAAIASLSAPQPPAEAHPVAWLSDWKHAANGGVTRDADIAAAWEARGEVTPLYTAPPSAPVGAEGWRVVPVEDDPDMLAVETPDGRTWFAKRGDRVFELAEALALAQQPPAEAQPVAWSAAHALLAEFVDALNVRSEAVTVASKRLKELDARARKMISAAAATSPPSAPVGVEGHVKALRELRDTGDVSDWRLFESALDAAIAALAQQPAAVDASEREQVIARLREVEDALRETEHHGLGKGCGRMADGLAAQQPAAFINDGNSEADFIADDAIACTACGGSGHRDDQQPAAVDDAMVERAWEAAMEIKHNKESWFPMTKRRMKRALTAALAGQQGGDNA